MKTYLLFLLLAVLGTLVYHLGQKALHATMNPMVLLMAVYGLAFALSAAAAPFFVTAEPVAWREALLAWPVLALGAGIFLVEIGFLLAYRYAAPLQWSAAAVNGLSAALLVPVALLLFGESLTLARLAGLGCVLAGLFLLVRA